MTQKGKNPAHKVSSRAAAGTGPGASRALYAYMPRTILHLQCTPCDRLPRTHAVPAPCPDCNRCPLSGALGGRNQAIGMAGAEAIEPQPGGKWAGHVPLGGPCHSRESHSKPLVCSHMAPPVPTLSSSLGNSPEHTSGPDPVPAHLPGGAVLELPRESHISWGWAMKQEWQS